ncbi:MAG: aromatic ring-hydroxylating dioxygenase subunit alpha [Pseudomonadota bacterium]
MDGGDRPVSEAAMDLSDEAAAGAARRDPFGAEIAPDPHGRADALAARFYTDPEVERWERDTLLRRHWQLVCHEAEVAAPGALLPFELHGQDLFLARDAAGPLRAFENVCPHRGHRLVDGPREAARITCPYHAWTFGLDGALRGARGVDRRDAEGAARDLDRFGLREWRVDRLAGFVFVNADPAAPSLADHAPGLEAQMLRACPDLPDYRAPRDAAEFGHSYRCEANWKVLIDNYLECYHCQMAHPEFDALMAIPDSRFALFRNFTHQRAPTKGRAENKAFPLDLTYDVLVGEFWWMFPNTTFGRFPGVQNFYASRYDPDGPGAARRLTLSLAPAEPTDPGAAQRDRMRSDWVNGVVSAEDRALCEAVQRGMSRTGFVHGWYVASPEDHGISEHAMRHWHDAFRAEAAAVWPDA